MIKLRISDDDLADAVGRIVYCDDVNDMTALRRAIESAGIEAPAVTVEELAEVVRFSWLNCNGEQCARAVLELMQRRTVPAAPGSQWVDLARVTDDELADQGDETSDGAKHRAWLIEKCGGAR